MDHVDLKVLNRMSSCVTDSLILHRRNPVQQKFVKNQPLKESVFELSVDASTSLSDDEFSISNPLASSGECSDDSSIETGRDIDVENHNLDIKCSNGKWKNIRNSTFNNEFTYSVMEIKDSLLSPIEEVKAPASGNDNNPAVETERGHRIPAGCKTLSDDDPPWLSDQVLKAVPPRTYTPVRKQNLLPSYSLKKCKLRSSSPNVGRPLPKAKRTIIETLEISPIQHGEVYGDSVELVPRPETPGTVNSEEILSFSLTKHSTDRAPDDQCNSDQKTSGKHRSPDLEAGNRSSNPLGDFLQCIVTPKLRIEVRNKPAQTSALLDCPRDFLEDF